MPDGSGRIGVQIRMMLPREHAVGGPDLRGRAVPVQAQSGVMIGGRALQLAQARELWRRCQPEPLFSIPMKSVKKVGIFRTNASSCLRLLDSLCLSRHGNL